MMKRNDGFTLVELLCAIVAGSIVTAATATILLLGLRMNANANTMATKDNQAVICLTVMENLVKENTLSMEEGKIVTEIKITDETGIEQTLFSFADGKIKTSTGAVLLENVAGCEFLMKDHLLTVKLTMNEGEEPFVKTIRSVTGHIINIG